jgi:hypothetical protein
VLRIDRAYIQRVHVVGHLDPHPHPHRVRWNTYTCDGVVARKTISIVYLPTSTRAVRYDTARFPPCMYVVYSRDHLSQVRYATATRFLTSPQHLDRSLTAGLGEGWDPPAHGRMRPVRRGLHADAPVAAVLQVVRFVSQIYIDTIRCEYQDAKGAR